MLAVTWYSPALFALFSRLPAPYTSALSCGLIENTIVSGSLYWVTPAPFTFDTVTACSAPSYVPLYPTSDTPVIVAGLIVKTAVPSQTL